MKKITMIEPTQKPKLSVTVSECFDTRLNLDNIITKESILSKKSSAIVTNDCLESTEEQFKGTDEWFRVTNDWFGLTNDWFESTDEWLKLTNEWFEPTEEWFEGSEEWFDSSNERFKPTNERVFLIKTQNNSMLYKLTLLINL
ncbi:MAG: hypothetical protein DRJ01_15290 [Bacteroidetes bacterium]|nr:MAG: hypothetical protein DRJ01_15290 [Bacteroidota bacterium]